MKAKLFLLSFLAIVSLTVGCEWIESTGSSESSVGNPVVLPAEFTPVPNPITPPPIEGPAPIVTNPPLVNDEGLILKNAYPRTAAASVEAEFVTLNRYKVKIGYDQQCLDGQWEDYSPTKWIQLQRLNQVVTISVQYRDWDGGISPCYTQSFIQDSAGPNILFQRYPTANLEEGSSFSLSLLVSDSLSDIKSVVCQMNGVERPCLEGASDINITAMPAGTYDFTVKATDELGNENQKSITWTVVSTTREITQGIRVNDYKKVDILFVIDNSGSMAYEQQSMAQRTSQFISVLRGLDWQIAVTTTDPRNITLGDGRLIPLTGTSGQYILSSAMNESSAQSILSRTLQRAETGSGSEQGIRATYRLVERFVSNEPVPKTFFREGAQFSVVLISDEDESDNTPKNDPRGLLDLVQNTFSGQKMFSYHSIITRPGDQACQSTYGATYGERYQMMTQLSGGLLGNVCEMDYSAQVQGIAEGIRNLLKTLTLQCAPLIDRGIQIKRDGVLIAANFQVEGVNLRFNEELLPGSYEVLYRCIK